MAIGGEDESEKKNLRPEN